MSVTNKAILEEANVAIAEGSNEGFWLAKNLCDSPC